MLEVTQIHVLVSVVYNKLKFHDGNYFLNSLAIGRCSKKLLWDFVQKWQQMLFLVYSC